MTLPLYHELLALTRLAEVARVADSTPKYRSGLETPVERDILAALAASPTLAAALGFGQATVWVHGKNLHADLIGEADAAPTYAEVKIWSQENSNLLGYQFKVMADSAPDDADLVVITGTRRVPRIAKLLGENPVWRIITLAEIAAVCEDLLRSAHLAGVTAAVHPDLHEAIRAQALGSARLAA